MKNIEMNQDLIEKRYLKIKSSGMNEDFLDKKAFGEIKIFINLIPKNLLFPVPLEHGDDKIYIGTN